MTALGRAILGAVEQELHGLEIEGVPVLTLDRLKYLISTAETYEEIEALNLVTRFDSVQDAVDASKSYGDELQRRFYSPAEVQMSDVLTHWKHDGHAFLHVFMFPSMDSLFPDTGSRVLN